VVWAKADEVARAAIRAETAKTRRDFIAEAPSRTVSRAGRNPRTQRRMGLNIPPFCR
jgi:hypothetical protein